jgi:hypothetical protein
MREKPDNSAIRCLGCGVKIEDFGKAECYDSDGMDFMCCQCSTRSNKNTDLFITSIERFLNGNVI